jgi:hypothetical protein
MALTVVLNVEKKRGTCDEVSYTLPLLAHVYNRTYIVTPVVYIIVL